MISKLQNVSSGVHQLDKFKNRLCELQNWFSPKVLPLHLECHGDLSNGLAQVTCCINKRI